MLKRTPKLETTVHSFGFTASHDAKLLSWLTSAGTNVGCFQYIQESGEIETSMKTTVALIGDNAMALRRKVDIALVEDGQDSVEPKPEDWITVKLEADATSGSTVVRGRPFNGSKIVWREHVEGDANVSENSNNNSTDTENPIRNMSVRWLNEDDMDRVLGMTTFIQYELLRMVETINSVSTSRTKSAEQKRKALLDIDAETENYSRALGALAFASARNKVKTVREPCMEACSRTRSLLQSFLSLKADAHKQGTISNTSLATFNALAYGGITESRLKAKLDSRAGKNSALFADIDTQVEEIVKKMDFAKMEAEVSEDTKRELSCAFSTNSYIEALQEGDCLCMTLDVTRSVGAIADASQLVIKSIFPTYLTSSMFTLALDHALSMESPENVHGGFRNDRNASIAPGLAQENITAVMPIFINKEHWEVARLRMKPILGYVVTLDATGYTYSQSTTVPFLILAKAIEDSYEMTEFKQRQFQLILDTCDAIYQSSRNLRETTKTMVQDYCASHVNRTVDVVTNNFIFLGHILCAVRAGDLSPETVSELLPQLQKAMVEEQIRRDLPSNAAHLMGNVMDWFDTDYRKDMYNREKAYRDQHAAYVQSLEASSGGQGEAESLSRETFLSACKAQLGEMEAGVQAASTSTTDLTASLAVAEPAVNLKEPVLEGPQLDLNWTLPEAASERLELIQKAVAQNVDKVLRQLALIGAGPTNEVIQSTLLNDLGTVAWREMAKPFFENYSDKVLLATMLQAFAHAKNADRRGVIKIMTPFQYTREGTRPAVEEDEALQYLEALHRTKVNQNVAQIVSEVQALFEESRNSGSASLFCTTDSLEVAAGLLLSAGTRGKNGGPLVTACAQRKMKHPREKILMLVEGMFRGVRLFSDKCVTGEDILKWKPCRQNLYRLFKNHHSSFSLNEWRQFHPSEYDRYIACRYVLDGYCDELTVEERLEVLDTFHRTSSRPIPR
ncbi:hypothetical protein BGZ94_001137 [Podila epigama]|nr:hypothetical protein BGZ94_001137 [Podila epigama]